MIRFEHLFFCMVITLSVTTFILHWRTPDDKRKHVHLRTSVKMCELDATCDMLETCHHNMCVHFWPMSAAKTRACHLGCEQDIRLYEDHFNLKNITDVKPFEGISKDTCVISYRVVGTAPGLSVSEYERRKRGSVRRTERLDDVNVALCTKMKSSGIENKPVDHAVDSDFTPKMDILNDDKGYKNITQKHGLVRDQKSQTFVHEIIETKTEDPLPSLRRVAYYSDFTPKMDVVWSRGWYMINKPPNVPIKYYNHQHMNPKTEHFDLRNIFRDPCNSQGPIWVRTRDLNWWAINILPTIRDCQVVLISSDGIDDIPVSVSQGQAILDSKSIKTWYAQNVVRKHQKLVAVPLGLTLHNGMVLDGKDIPNMKHTMEYMEKIHVGTKKIRILHDKGGLAGGRRTKYRNNAYQKLRNCVNIDVMEKRIPRVDAWEKYSSYAFGTVVTGMGWDVHRVWEYFYFGTIPIVERTPLTDSFEGTYLPWIVVDDWSEVCSWDSDKLHKLYKKYEKWIGMAREWLKPDMWVPRNVKRMHELWMEATKQKSTDLTVLHKTCLKDEFFGRNCNRIKTLANALLEYGSIQLPKQWSDWYISWFDERDDVGLYYAGQCTQTVIPYEIFFKFGIQTMNSKLKTLIPKQKIRHQAELKNMSKFISVHAINLEHSCITRSRKNKVHCFSEQNDNYSDTCNRNFDSFKNEEFPIILFTDNHMSFSSFANVNHDDFKIQMWMMTLSETHYGVPASSVDWVVAHWRGSKRTEPLACYKQTISESINGVKLATEEQIDYVLTGVLKNIVRQKGENHLRIHIRKLLELGQSLGSFHLILYENDSSDNTRNVLKSMLSNNSMATLLFEDNIHTNGRTHAIARARNIIVEHVETHFSTSKYMIMTDMDGVCGAEDPTKSYDPEVFKYVVSRSDEWDALSFRNRPYWDLWAFRHSEYMPYNKFGSKNHLNKIQVFADWDTFFGHETDFFPVDSAFMMLAIYKISFIMGIRYSGTGIHGEADCEHVAFHRGMKQKKGARVMVSPLVYCEDGKGYKNITQKHEQKTVHNIDQITIKNNMGFNRDEPCDLPCHYTTSDEKVDATVYELRGRRAPPSGISVYMQMEGEHYYPIDTTGWTVENTYRWSSPLLKPYFELVHYHGETDIQSKRVTQDAISGISFLARNCGSRNNREQVVQDLIQQVRVDAMSSCLHNHDKPPEDKNLPWISNKIKLLRAYKFHAAFENGNVRDYVTEKVYTALAAGTVPIYMGAPNIDEFVPKGSIIRVDSFEDTAALAKHIQECLTNETLYQSYHDWRDRPLNSEFVEKFAFTNVTTECRTCRWVYAHKHGLPWDKKSQTVQMPETKTEVPLPSLRHVDPFIGTATTTSTKEHHVDKYTIPDSLKPYVTTHPKGGLFVKTGDIPEMWIRDSVAQVWPYRDSHPGMIAEVLYRQSEFILHDVYANSYNLKWQVSDKLNRHMQTLGRGEWVGTRNYELDSGCYFLRLLYHAWKKHHLEIKTFRPSVELLVETWQVEQYHEEQSPYRYPELKRNGLSTPVKWTGMTWTGFRPSDDPCTYGYHIPDNLFAAKALEYVSEMFPDIKEARTLRRQILTGVQEHGTWTDNDGKKRYCYEVDGLGGCNKMDDANVPSLLSIPYLDPEGYDHVIWQNTYEWIWSSKNPYFYKGTAAAGIGSPHTPAQYIWPMSLVMRGLVDTTVAEEMRDQIEKTKVRGKLHESFHKDDPKRLTREDFSWPNELYKELNI